MPWDRTASAHPPGPRCRTERARLAVEGRIRPSRVRAKDTEALIYEGGSGSGKPCSRPANSTVFYPRRRSGRLSGSRRGSCHRITQAAPGRARARSVCNPSSPLNVPMISRRAASHRARIRQRLVLKPSEERPSPWPALLAECSRKRHPEGLFNSGPSLAITSPKWRRADRKPAFARSASRALRPWHSCRGEGRRL